ncbi:M48 family metallopeptidase [Streptacidiphilus sp. EB129]|uniref:M48 family metallopeptidase n=1 Tax=Streptacidiphilus sp. EB129 TaxID=3156262 RepID=UPI0035184343
MTTPPSAAITAAGCTECGSPLTTDPRFVQWCPSCHWNAVPKTGREAAAEHGRIQQRLNRSLEERLYEQVTSGAPLRPAHDGVWAAALVMAGLVHLVSVAVVGCGGWLLLQPGWPGRVIGALVLVAAVALLRPRLGSLRAERRKPFALDRAHAPVLYALADATADALGTRRPELIVVDDSYNAGYQRVGLRQRVVLHLGLPLWESLRPAERLALLGHEFGHGANGDSRRGLWVGSALRGLAGWHEATTTTSIAAPRGLAALAALLTRLLLGLVNVLIRQCYRLLAWLTRASSRRAEYLADAFALRIAGREGAAGLVEALTLEGAYEHLVLQRRGRVQRVHRRRGGDRTPEDAAGDLWTELRAYVASIPPEERTRRILVSELGETATDSTHPPKHLRLAFVRRLSGPYADAEPLALPDFTAIDAELASARAGILDLLDGRRSTVE